MPVLPLQVFDDLLQASPFRCHVGLHRLQAVAQGPDRLPSGQVYAQGWPPPPERQGTWVSRPQGSYTYDSAHYHAVDAIGSSAYEAQYDASGNMTCRTPTNAAVCTSSSQTGATFTSDVEGRLIQWVSADGSTTVKYGYDGEGQRFEMQVVTSSTATTTTYISNLEEVQVVGSTTTKMVYFYFGGQRVAEDENTHWYYPLSDQLTSTTVVVDYTGAVAAQLFAPYGQSRWAGGTMPTSYAFTGQRADSATGLDYYGARYYDPVAGTFTSADTVRPDKGFSPTGLNRYAYVSSNPETLTDPTGHYMLNGPCADGEWCKPIQTVGGGGGGGGSSPAHKYPNPCGSGVAFCHFHYDDSSHSWLIQDGAKGTILVGVGYYGIMDVWEKIDNLLTLYETYGPHGSQSNPDFSALGYELAQGLDTLVGAVITALSAASGPGAAIGVAAASLVIGTLQDLQGLGSQDNSSSAELPIPDVATQLSALKNDLYDLATTAATQDSGLGVEITEADYYNTPIYQYCEIACFGQGGSEDNRYIVGYALSEVDFNITVFDVNEPPRGPATQP